LPADNPDSGLCGRASRKGKASVSAIIAREVDHTVRTPTHAGRRESRLGLFRPDDYVYRPAGGERQTLVCDWDAAHGREGRHDALRSLSGPISLSAVLDAAIESLPKVDRARRIDRSLHDPEIRLTRDPVRTAQALLRLLANACRFSSSMTPIRIRSRIDTADDADHLVLTIADRGVGISRAHQHRAFEPFWRGPQTGETPGQGMGLPIARRLIEAQGGWIELRSALGVGPEVEVWLPPELSADRPA
jgi:hypothetical protein